MNKGPLGSADPLVKGIIPSMFGILGFSILLNLFNAVVRRKLVDQEKLQRIMKETKAWQKERMSAFRAKNTEKQAELNKKSAYMSRLNQEMMQMNMRPMMITFVPLILIFYFVLPPLFAYTVALSPVSLNVIPGDFFSLTCPADKIDGKICHNEHDVYFWGWYFLGSIAFSGIIMKLTKTSMDLS
ncbi:MAG: EMC3/TMCO1 family protein [Candidatus Nitrosotenuis sp.]